MNKVRVILNVGHGDNGIKYDPGAVNERLGVQEHIIANQLVDEIIKQNDYYDLELIKVKQKSWGDLPNQINQINPDFCVSFHLNSFTDEKATGTEMLYWYDSYMGQRLAETLYNEVQELLKLKKRYVPVKPLGLNDRGAALLYKTVCPTVITESYFISNNMDVEIGQLYFKSLACTYLTSIYMFADKYYINGA